MGPGGLAQEDGDDAGSGPEPTRVAVMGLGKLGLAVAGGLLGRADIQLVAGVDVDEQKVGCDLGELLEIAPTGISVGAELPENLEVDLAVLTTASYMAGVFEQIVELASRGINVLTSAEELGYPWRAFEQEARTLDAVARSHGVTVLGAGANPGYLMDVLPITLTLATQRVRSVRVTRTLDLRPQRPHRARRFGIGMTADELRDASTDLITGHTGFGQSIDAVADALGWSLDRVETSPVTPLVIAGAARGGSFFAVEPGQVAVVEQRAQAWMDDELRVDLHEYFGFIAPEDPVRHGDTYEIHGEDQSFTASVEPGILSYVTTPAVIVNLANPVVRAAPGLLTSIDLPVRELGSKGALARTPVRR